MIPVKLILQGLYSYQDKQTIDFSRLTAANLFGIFGTVGCGKSSILEAITFALYGRTSRLNLSGDNRYYNMMNLKSNELLIDLIFETGKDQTVYRSVVKGKRNSKNFDEVKALDRSAYKLVNQEWIPVEIAEPEQAIGLSYDNFRRTIIIPQGQFQEFLQLGNKDRTQMMKELFDLGKFEFYSKVASLESKNNALKQTIEGKLQQLGNVEEAQVMHYQAQLVQLKQELEDLDVNLRNHQQQEVELKQLQVLTAKLKETEQGLTQLRRQEPEIKKLEKIIAGYEQCLKLFKPLFDSIESSSLRLKKKETLIQQETEELEKLDGDFIIMDQQLAVLKPAFEKREELKHRADELNLLIKIQSLHGIINQNLERQKKGMAILEQTIKILDELKSEKSALEALIRSQKQSLPDMTVLAYIKAWYVEMKGIETQLLDTDKQREKYNLEKDTIKAELHNLLADSLFEKLPDYSKIPVVLSFLDNMGAAIKKQLKLLEQESNELGIKARLHQFAGELSEGKACPLCGSLSHPEVYNAENIRESQQELNQLKEKKEKESEKIQELTNRFNDLSRQLSTTEGYIYDWTTRREHLLGKQRAHLCLFTWDKFNTKEELDKAFLYAEQVQSTVRTKEKELDVLNVKLEKELKNKERFQVELEKITNSLTAGQTETRTLQEQLRIIVPQEHLHRAATEIDTEKANLLENYKQLEEQFNELNTQIDKNRNAAIGLTGGLEANRRELLQEKDTRQKLIKQAEEELKKTSYQSLDEVRKILAQSILLEHEKQKLEDFKHQQALLNEKFSQLVNEINNRTYEPEKHAGILLEIESFKKALGEKNQATGKVTELLKKLQQDLESRKSMLKEHEKLEMRAENIRTMKSLFKASGFVNYVSSVYLQNLCHAANERFFRLTRQKLSLEITPDNNFQVRDFMNGGRIRSVKTLSGGQTFQAALSLALALADNIQTITESNQNFFFLDEGFGSLDKESLGIVFDTLKTLRKENRIVGVISHVEEMQQEIDMYLRIENHEEKGSMIKPCWVG